MKRILDYFGSIQKRKMLLDIFYTGLNQMWRIVSGPIILILIPLYLSPEIQGYWYTITGLSFLIIFADLGFSNIVLQFAAHEFAFLKFDKNMRISGDEDHLKKLASFFVFSMKWALFVITITLPVMIAISLFILTRRQTDIPWSVPWMLYFAGSILVFFNNVILYFFEGCDSVALVQRIRLIISIVLTLFMCSGIVLGFNLYALALSLIASALSGVLAIAYVFRRPILQLYEISRKYHYAWKTQFFSLLWRYAISWASGYFIFQIYTPLMFYYHGPVSAGKIGISIAVWTAIYSISSVWLTSATPKMNIHVSRKEWGFLDAVFNKRLILSCFTFLLGAIAFFLLFYSLKGRFHVIDRFADETTMGMLAIAWFIQTIINSLAIYLRAHKQEPLAIPSLISAIYITITTLLCAKYLRSDYFFLGFLSSYLFTLPWVLIIYRGKKKELSKQYGTASIDMYPNI